MDMSRITLTIDRLVLKGFAAAEQRALVEGLQGELSRALSDPRIRIKSFSKPLLKLGGIPLEPGCSGGAKFGSALARSIGRGLRP